MTTPKLRFKEFDGDWIKTTLLDLSENKSLNNGVFNDQNKVGKGYKLINVLDMYIERDIDEHCLSLLDLNPKEFERNKVKYGDIFFTRSSLVKEGIAFSNVYLGKSDDVTYDGHLIKLSPDLNRINSIFLNLALKTSKVRKQLIQGGKTATMTTIGQKEVGTTRIDIPLKDEQTKIASFLSAVDEKISQLTQKHALLSQYKQGMMQKLFSQQIRFKADDGSDFGEWVNKKIIEIADYVDYRGKTPKKVDSGILLVTAKNIRFGYIDYEVSREYISSDDFDEVMRRGHAKIGDVLITTEAPLGNVASVDREDIALAQRVIKYRGKEGVLDNAFLKQKFLSEDFQSLISSKATGGTVQGIKGSTLHNLEIKIPRDLKEQIKIANFLSAIDQKIEVVAQQIEQAKQWKKGLLQQMFV